VLVYIVYSFQENIYTTAKHAREFVDSVPFNWIWRLWTGFFKSLSKYNVDVCESPTNQREAQLTNVLKHIFFQKLKIKIPLNNLKIMTQNGAFWRFLKVFLKTILYKHMYD